MDLNIGEILESESAGNQINGGRVLPNPHLKKGTPMLQEDFDEFTGHTKNGKSMKTFIVISDEEIKNLFKSKIS